MSQSGKQLPGMGIRVPALAAFDWGGRKGKTVATYDGETVVVVQDLKEVIDTLAGIDDPETGTLLPATMVGETTFESYFPDRRNDILDYAAERNVRILTSHTRNTPRWRERFLGEEKSEDSDARALWAAYVDNPDRFAVAKPGREYSGDWLAKERRTGYPSYEAVRQVTKGFQPNLLTENGKNKTALMTLAGAAGASASREEYERKLGLYGSGRGSIYRSNLYRHALKRLLPKGKEVPETGMVLSDRKEALRTMRREARKFWHDWRLAGTLLPETGTIVTTTSSTTEGSS